MGTDSFLFFIKTEGISADIANNVETRFTSRYKLERSLNRGKNKKIIGLLKGELYRKITMEFAALRPKIYNYLTDDNNENKEVKIIKSVS